MKKSFAGQRLEYTLKKFDAVDAHTDPFHQFQVWFDEAHEVFPDHSNAMILSTSSLEGRPSSRVVLLKEIDTNGFVFFTNYLSRKGKELTANPFSSLLFFWPGLERQIRIEGKVEKISSSASAEYFSIRPRESQIAAMISEQSAKITGRLELEEKFAETIIRFEGKDIPKPVHWGGFCLKPFYFEFWQGRLNRMHDRITYNRENQKWITGRLSP
jgi:pyridoxamine 5'-phosphate oxidase